MEYWFKPGQGSPCTSQEGHPHRVADSAARVTFPSQIHLSCERLWYKDSASNESPDARMSAASPA